MYTQTVHTGVKIKSLNFAIIIFAILMFQNPCLLFVPGPGVAAVVRSPNFTPPRVSGQNNNTAAAGIGLFRFVYVLKPVLRAGKIYFLVRQTNDNNVTVLNVVINSEHTVHYERFRVNF